MERALDFAKTAGALDAVVRHATTERTSSTTSALEPSAEEYALAITKLEGRKEALFERYAAMELEEGRVARVEDFDALEPAPRGGAAENGHGSSETAGPSKARERPAFVPKLALGALAGGGSGEAEAQTETRAGPPGREEADVAERSGDAPASSPRLVATPPRPGPVSDSSPPLDPSPERVAVARLARECAVLEGRIRHRVERRAAEANERRLRARRVTSSFRSSAARCSLGSPRWTRRTDAGASCARRRRGCG